MTGFGCWTSSAFSLSGFGRTWTRWLATRERWVCTSRRPWTSRRPIDGFPQGVPNVAYTSRRRCAVREHRGHSRGFAATSYWWSRLVALLLRVICVFFWADHPAYVLPILQRFDGPAFHETMLFVILILNIFSVQLP